MTKKEKIIRTMCDYPNLTNYQIAQRVGCHPTYVNQVENKWLSNKGKEPMVDHYEAARERIEAAQTQSEKSEGVEHVSVPTTDAIDAGSSEDLLGDLCMAITDEVDAQYDALTVVLGAAYMQAARGKGAERHANNAPWTEQPIFTIARQVGDGFNAGQVIKKTQEAQQMAARGETAKAQHEILGAIVYAASLHVLWGWGDAE